MTNTMPIMVSSPPVSHSTGEVSELCTVWIHQLRLAKLSNAVLPSSTATTPAEPTGRSAAFKPARGLTSRRLPSTDRRQGDSRATVVA